MGEKKKIIGLTGTFSSGKTTLAAILSGKGAKVIDADDIAHWLIDNDKSIKSALVKKFGESILERESINRVKLREIIFSKDKNIKWLNKITHPLIITEIENAIKSAVNAVIVVDAPLLIETGFDKNMDMVVVIHSDSAKQIERAAKRGFTEKEAVRIINSQLTASEKIKKADFVIENNGTKGKIKKGAEELWIRIQNL